jgi:hypothetical protein
LFTDSSNAAQIIQSAQSDQKVEVILAPGCEGTDVALRLSTWTEGLGWCAQKTICLSADQLDELHRAVVVVRQRVRRRRAHAGQPRESAQIIRLPTLS